MGQLNGFIAYALVRQLHKSGSNRTYVAVSLRACAGVYIPI